MTIFSRNKHNFVISEKNNTQPAYHLGWQMPEYLQTPCFDEYKPYLTHILRFMLRGLRMMAIVSAVVPLLILMAYPSNFQ